MQSALNWLFNALYEIFIGWLVALLTVLREGARHYTATKRRLDEGQRYVRCQPIPADVYKRPDPLLYCQAYLMSLGLAVTWDNPDIQLYELDPVSKPISSNDLQPDTEYEIHATIYNGSSEAPAINMPVEFSYLSFGIGTQSHPIGTTKVDLHVKGSPQHPSTARMRWRTPRERGHYCIQVKLVWSDDANPNNNLGQENTHVGITESPAFFDFATYNGSGRRRIVRLTPDAYTIPGTTDCEELARRDNPYLKNHEPRAADGSKEVLDAARRTWCVAAARRHEPDRYPLPAGWAVRIEPEKFTQEMAETTTVEVQIAPPEGWTGKQAININGFDDDTNAPLGGVTLYVLGR